MTDITRAWEANGSRDGFRVYLYVGAQRIEQDRMRLVFPRLDWADRYAEYLNCGNPQCTSIDEVHRKVIAPFTTRREG